MSIVSMTDIINKDNIYDCITPQSIYEYLNSAGFININFVAEPRLLYSYEYFVIHKLNKKSLNEIKSLIGIEYEDKDWKPYRNTFSELIDFNNYEFMGAIMKNCNKRILYLNGTQTVTTFKVEPLKVITIKDINDFLTNSGYGSICFYIDEDVHSYDYFVLNLMHDISLMNNSFSISSVEFIDDFDNLYHINDIDDKIRCDQVFIDTLKKNHPCDTRIMYKEVYFNKEWAIETDSNGYEFITIGESPPSCG